MPLGFTVTKTLLGRSERVKSVEIHPAEPWVLAGLYSGEVFLWNHETGSLVRSFEVSDVPVRCARFVVRQKWIVCGSDDMMIRVYNYNTHEKVREFEAHTDYIRCIAIHPNLPYIMTSSDDMSVKLWDWSQGWENTMIFEGHTHYVMQVEINPKDSSTFASASLDRSIRVWGLTSQTPHFTLEGHERGVNCVSYYPSGDRPWLVSGADDHLVKIWDYQNKTCIATLEGHTSNVSAVAFHPSLPIILSGSEDNTIRVWHSSTYQWEDTLNYSMERCWGISALDNSNKVAFGYDLGTVMVSLGREEPVASMDRSGKITFSRGNELFRKMIQRKDESEDGEMIALPEKELITADCYPQKVKHNTKGTFIAVCGDGEYTIYTALKLGNKSYGSAKEFVWSDRKDTYATLETKGKIQIFKKFKPTKSMRPSFSVEGIFGGHLLGVKSDDFIDFYDWDELRVVRRIEVCPDKVYWSDSVCVLACVDSMFVLEYDEEITQKYFEKGLDTGEEGIDNSFSIQFQNTEKVTSGGFEGDVFFYTNTAGRLNYLVGEKTMTLAHLDKNYYILGYFNKTNRVYLMDKNHNVVSYKLQLELLYYQVAIVREDYEAAADVLESIDPEHYTMLARFLEQNGLHEMALDVTTDPDHKFELAISLKDVKLAHSLVCEDPTPEKWKQLTDCALEEFEFEIAIEASTQAEDLSSLLLIYSSLGHKSKLAELGKKASAAGRYNIAFSCAYLTHNLEECLAILLETKRFAEAAMFARSYCPSQIERVTEYWKFNLAEDKPEIAKAICTPSSHPALWPNLQTHIEAEQAKQDEGQRRIPSSAYLQWKNRTTSQISEPVQQEEVVEDTEEQDVQEVQEVEENEEEVVEDEPEQGNEEVDNEEEQNEEEEDEDEFADLDDFGDELEDLDDELADNDPDLGVDDDDDLVGLEDDNVDLDDFGLDDL